MKKLNWMYILAIIAGAFYATGFPMYKGHTFILGPIIAFFLLNWCLELSSTLKSKFLIAWLFALGFYQTGYYWIPHTLKEFGGLDLPFNYLLGILFSFILLPQVYFYSYIKTRVKSILGLSFSYALLEYFVPQQFPSHLGHTFISLVPEFKLNFAPVMGSAFYSFLVCLIALSLLQHFKTKIIPKLHYALITFFLLISFLPIELYKNETTAQLNIRVVQPNVGNFIKLDSERGGINSLKSVFDNYYQLSTTESHVPLDLIIWPETAFPTLLSSYMIKNSSYTQVPQLFKDISSKTGSELFVGGYDLNPNSMGQNGFESDYNTAFYFSKNSELKNTYHKIKLIPFGEGLPFGPLNQFLSRYITNVSFFAKGEKYTQFQLENGHGFSAAICYEILFPIFIRDLLNDPEKQSSFLINLTNDSWYGDTLEPYQHLFLSKWRALEFNIPIIRSTNTGITTIIYPDGRESKRLMIYEKTILDESFKFNSRNKTPYQMGGIWIFVIFGIALIFLEKNLLLKGHANG